MSDRLAIWLNDLQVAVVERDRNRRLRLSYTDLALETFEGGTPLLSLNLPLTSTRYPNERTTVFLDGLLPEGEARNAVAAEFDLTASDVFGLLAAIGKDCAGALVVQLEGDPAPAVPTTTTAEPLSSDDLAKLVANLRSAPLGIDRNVRLSLAGVQEKLLLTRMPDGRWGRPTGGTPSTHILKPEIEPLGNTVENEVFCMRVAKHLGLDVANVETILVDERPVLVVERYDRVIGDNGTVTRVHQEDLCQALGIPPRRKYEQDGGPSLARIARVLQEVAEQGATENFLRALTLNVGVGNCDAHPKNFSLLHSRSGALRLAPLYDVLSTRFYPGLSDKLAMYVDAVQTADRVSADRIVNEAVSWSMSRSRARQIVADALHRLPDAVTAAADETAGVPETLIELVTANAERLTRSLEAGAGH